MDAIVAAVAERVATPLSVVEVLTSDVPHMTALAAHLSATVVVQRL